MLGVKGNQVRIGTQAPDDVTILREELLETAAGEWVITSPAGGGAVVWRLRFTPVKPPQAIRHPFRQIPSIRVRAGRGSIGLDVQESRGETNFH